MHTKRFYTFFKRWVQFRVGAIPRLPKDRPYFEENVQDFFIIFNRFTLILFVA